MLSLDHQSMIAPHFGHMYLMQSGANSSPHGGVNAESSKGVTGISSEVSNNDGGDEFDDFYTEEDMVENQGWAEQFEDFRREDAEKEERKMEKKRAQPSATPYYSCNQLRHSFAPIELPSPPQEDNERPDSPQCPVLGVITYCLNGEHHTAGLTPSGGIVHDGVRYRSVTHWLKQVFNKRM